MKLTDSELQDRIEYVHEVDHLLEEDKITFEQRIDMMEAIDPGMPSLMRVLKPENEKSPQRIMNGKCD